MGLPVTPRRAGKSFVQEASGRALTERGVHWHRVGPGGLNECHNPPAEGCADVVRGVPVTITQIARTYGVSATTAHNWFARQARTRFPDPIGEKPKIAGQPGAPGFEWDADEVERWHQGWVAGRRGRR